MATATPDKATKGKSTTKDEDSESKSSTEVPSDATQPVAQETKELTPSEIAQAAKAGDQVSAPIGGMPLFVQHKFRSGGVLLTEDGEGRYDGPCKHDRKLVDEGPASTRVYWEFVGGELNGQRGYLHRIRGCQRTYETLTANA